MNRREIEHKKGIILNKSINGVRDIRQQEKQEKENTDLKEERDKYISEVVNLKQEIEKINKNNSDRYEILDL